MAKSTAKTAGTADKANAADAAESAWPHAFPGTNWLDEGEEQAVLEVLRRGALFRYYGPQQPAHVAALEARARDYYGVKHALAVSSGTGALMTTMSAMGIGPGSEVIVPAFLWVSTVSAVIHANAIPVLCEVDDSLCMDPDDLGRRITPLTRLIVPVHMAGEPCDMGRIMAVARGRNIPVLEDCAQSNGATFQGRKAGTFGSAGMFSFQLNKNVTAGEGGLIITDDEDLYWRLVAVHDVGVPWKSAAPDSAAGIHLWGQGRRMSELCGAVANVQLGKLPDVVAHMRASKGRIKEALSGVAGLAFRRPNDPDGDSGPFLTLLLESEARVTRAAGNMKAAGLRNASRLADYGLHLYYNITALVRKVPLSPSGNPWALLDNAWSVYEYGKGACPRSDGLFARAIIIHIPSRLSEPQERQMAGIIRQAVESA